MVPVANPPPAPREPGDDPGLGAGPGAATRRKHQRAWETYNQGLISDPTSPTLRPQEHLRQLQRVYGLLSPAFVAEELECTVEEATRLLYGPHADRFCWVSLADLAHLSGVSLSDVKRWVRRQNVQSAPQRGQGRTASPCIHLDDARHFLSQTPAGQETTADALPRLKGEDLGSVAAKAVTQAPSVDVDWQLARQAAWPMTVERLAEAVFGSRAAAAQQQSRVMLRRWEAQGKVICFARGLYDLLRPSVVLAPERYGRSVLPTQDIQKLRAHHPEIAHWASRPLAAAWRDYSRFYAGSLLPVADRAEPTFLEYLLVCQLNPGGMPGKVDARYEELCQEAAFYRLMSAPPQPAAEPEMPPLTLENIKAGLIDFEAAAEATRLKMQRGIGKGQTPARGRKTTAHR